MKITCRVPYIKECVNGQNVYGLTIIDPSQIKVSQYALIAIDGSTSSTGIAILRDSDAALMYVMKVEREKKTETPVQYKVRLKRWFKDLLSNNRLIQLSLYEEPCIDNITAIANIFMLRTFIEELIVENEPELDYLKTYEISNKRWKKIVLEPEPCPVGTELEKKAVREKLLKYLPFLDGITQDEFDAIGLGISKVLQSKKGITPEEMESKKKATPFKFNVDFIGADDDDTMLAQLYDVYKGPEKLLSNGLQLVDFKSRLKFDNTIYEKMGDDDKVLILKFASKYHGNIALKYNIGYLVNEFEYIYAVVWRYTRKSI